MLMRDRDRKWNAVKVASDFDIADKGTQTIGFQYRIGSEIFDKLGGERDAKVHDSYAIIRYDGVIIFVDHPGKNRRSLPTAWWDDPEILYKR